MEPLKPLIWIGSSKKDYMEFPQQIKQEMGRALYLAQEGKKHKNAKPLKGFKGGSVMEIVEKDRSGTYRAVYTIQMAEAVYVLHVFQKKSKTGIKTPKQEIDLVKSRLKAIVTN